MSASAPRPQRVGVVGYGKLGQFLVKAICERPELEVAFVWNRSPIVNKEDLENVAILDDLSNVASM